MTWMLRFKHKPIRRVVRPTYSADIFTRIEQKCEKAKQRLDAMDDSDDNVKWDPNYLHKEHVSRSVWGMLDMKGYAR